MPLLCGPYLENFAIQRKETLTRTASYSEAMLGSINASAFQSLFVLVVEFYLFPNEFPKTLI